MIGAKHNNWFGLPEPVDEAEQYFRGREVRVDQIKQVSLGSIGVRGTPMMLLVNADGVVTKTWLGRLESQQQDEALSTLRKIAHVPQGHASGKG